MTIALRARLNAEGTLELLDPLPPNITTPQTVVVVLDDHVYINDFGDVIFLDETNGVEIPLFPPTHDEILGLLEEMSGPDVPDAGDYVRQMRQQSLRKTAPWPAQQD